MEHLSVRVFEVDPPMFLVKNNNQLFKVNEYTFRNLQVVVKCDRISTVYYQYKDKHGEIQWDAIRKDGRTDHEVYSYNSEEGMMMTCNFALKLLKD